MLSYIVDSFAPLTQASFDRLVSLAGAAPLAWGRYLDADLSRDVEVAAANGVPLFLIARRSSRVPVAGIGASDGVLDRAAFELRVREASIAGARVLSRVFLDVEMQPSLDAGYWRGWSNAWEGSIGKPSAYMPNRDNWPRSWLALEAAIEDGATCAGAWVAHYRNRPVDGSATLVDVDWASRPMASEHTPYLAWQHTGNAYGKAYDFSMLNPDLTGPVAGWLTEFAGGS